LARHFRHPPPIALSSPDTAICSGCGCATYRWTLNCSWCKSRLWRWIPEPGAIYPTLDATVITALVLQHPPAQPQRTIVRQSTISPQAANRRQRAIQVELARHYRHPPPIALSSPGTAICSLCGCATCRWTFNCSWCKSRLWRWIPRHSALHPPAVCEIITAFVLRHRARLPLPGTRRLSTTWPRRTIAPHGTRRIRRTLPALLSSGDTAICSQCGCGTYRWALDCSWCKARLWRRLPRTTERNRAVAGTTLTFLVLVLLACILCLWTASPGHDDERTAASLRAGQTITIIAARIAAA
jgi:hypothetical protein